MPKPLIFLRNRIGWFGAHSGYDCLVDQITKAEPDWQLKVVRPSQSMSARMLGKLVSAAKGFGARPQGYVAAIYQMARLMNARPDAVGHIVFGEEALPYLELFSKGSLSRLVITIHQPRAMWTRDMEAGLCRVRNLIVLYSQDLDYLSSHAAGPAKMLLHGVDTDFFRPGPSRSVSPPRVLYSGVHLRSTDMLKSVVQIVQSRRRDAEFVFLVPAGHPARRELEQKFAGNGITWLSGLNDNELLALYQTSTAMLLPLTDSGANTAVIEALSCGLPLITTRVGGIADYGGDSLFPTVELNDHEGMADLVCRYLDDDVFRCGTATKLRSFAEARLSWGHSVLEHLRFYEQVA